MDLPWIAPYGTPAADTDIKNKSEKRENAAQHLSGDGVVYKSLSQQKGQQQCHPRENHSVLSPNESSHEVRSDEHYGQHLFHQYHQYSKSTRGCSSTHVHDSLNQRKESPIDPVLLDYDKLARMPYLTSSDWRSFLECMDGLSNTGNDSMLSKQERDTLLGLLDMKMSSVESSLSTHSIEQDDSTNLRNDSQTISHDLPNIMNLEAEKSRASSVDRSIIGDVRSNLARDIQESSLLPVLPPERITSESQSEIAERRSMISPPLNTSNTSQVANQIHSQTMKEPSQNPMHLDLNNQQFQQVQQGSILKKSVNPEKSSQSRNLSLRKTDQILATESLNLEALDALPISKATRSREESSHLVAEREWETRLSAHRPYPHTTTEHHSYQVAGIGFPHHWTEPKHSERALLEANELTPIWRNNVDHSVVFHEDKSMRSYFQKCLGMSRNKRLKAISDEPRWTFGKTWDNKEKECVAEDLGHGLEDAKLLRDLFPSLYNDFASEAVESEFWTPN